MWWGPDEPKGICLISDRADVVGDGAAPWMLRALPRLRGVLRNLDGKGSGGFSAAIPSSEGVLLVAAVRHRGSMFEFWGNQCAK